METYNESSKKMNHLTVAIIMLLVGGLVGMGIGMAVKNSEVKDLKAKVSNSAGPSANTKAADLRATLVGLGVEHMALTDQAIADTLDGSPAASATAASLYTNGTNIGAAVGSVYGQEAEGTFNSVWKLHLDRFVDYAVAGSKADAMGQKDALDRIKTGYTTPLAQYLAKANLNINAMELEDALDHHVQETAKVIDLHIAKDYTEEAKQLSHANEHMVEIFSSLSAAIVKQFPEKF